MHNTVTIAEAKRTPITPPCLAPINKDRNIIIGCKFINLLYMYGLTTWFSIKCEIVNNTVTIINDTIPYLYIATSVINKDNAEPTTGIIDKTPHTIPNTSA